MRSHHLLGELVGAFRPGIDDLVVLLALGDEAVVVLLLIFLGERVVCSMIFFFVSGTTMSSLPKEMPALNASRKPSAMILSQKMTVSFCPQLR